MWYLKTPNPTEILCLLIELTIRHIANKFYWHFFIKFYVGIPQNKKEIILITGFSGPTPTKLCVCVKQPTSVPGRGRSVVPAGSGLLRRRRLAVRWGLRAGRGRRAARLPRQRVCPSRVSGWFRNTRISGRIRSTGGTGGLCSARSPGWHVV